jgi:signal transduction histidine kinase
MKKNYLSTQIKKVIGNRILFCSIAFSFIILGLTAYDLSVSIDQLRARINEQVKPIEDFAIGQVMIDNARTIDLKISSFNESSSTFKMLWIPSGNPKFNSITWSPPFSWVYDYKLGNIAGYSFGYFKIKGSFLSDKALVYDLIIRLTLLIIFTLAILSILYPLAKKIPEKLFIHPINRFIDLISNPDSLKKDLAILPIELEVLETKILTLLKQEKKYERDKAIIELGYLATSVAHDIRSPLTVLNIETRELLSIPEKNRTTIRNAIQRINDIANNLLAFYKEEKNKCNGPTLSSEPIAIILESIASEKRIQISNFAIDLTLAISPDAYLACANIDTIEFKRVLSNIINNSIESIKAKGLIIIKLSKTHNCITIDVIDNGCGIPEEKISLILKEGGSFGKHGGSGLGLSYSIDKISSWNGKYSLTSAESEGTHFSISLPQSKTASWIASEINLTKETIVIILDDDHYIHKIWAERFNDLLNQNIKILHFYSPTEVSNFYLTEKEKNILFLLDYEIINHKENGLALAEKLNIASKSILVTNRYEDMTIRATCDRLAIKIIPKPFAKDISINVFTNKSIVFIDDDSMITSLWKDCAMNFGIEISVFNDPTDFLRVLTLFEKNTLIYIDSILNHGIKGEYFSKSLYELGYRNIILATNLPKECFKDIWWVKDIVDKNPPFPTALN